MIEVNRILWLILLIGLIYAIYKYRSAFMSCSEDINQSKSHELYQQQSKMNMIECQGNKCSIYPPKGGYPYNCSPINKTLNNISEDNISQIDLPSLNDEDPTERDSLFNSDDTPQNMVTSEDLNQDNTTDSLFN